MWLKLEFNQNKSITQKYLALRNKNRLVIYSIN